MKGKNTKIVHKHEAMSYGLIVKASEDVPTELLAEYNILTAPVIYRGKESRPDVARHFVDAVTDISLNIEKLLKTNITINMSVDDVQAHEAATHCNLCKIEFSPPSETLRRKTADHCHLSGKYRQALCNVCNQRLQTQKFVPIFFHNLSNYDAHLIVTELGHDTQTIKVIPNSEENYISFSKFVSSRFSIRFIDTFRFMATSLSSLAINLITSGLENFREIAKVFTGDDMPLVTRKGVYPYEYTDSWDKLDDRRLPRKRDFYSTLTESGIMEEEFEHAKEVWDHFNCKTLDNYSDLYLKIDVLLLADIFENFRDVCMKTYNLDPAHYFTAPSLSFHVMLKYTGKKLELLTDYDMLLMFENGIRGGLVQASMRYAKANNAKTPGYDETKEKSWLIYQDCNNLYGWAMSEYMPYGDFNLVEPNLDGLNDLTATSDKGRVYEVDVSYPKELHDNHNDLPFLPQNSIQRGSKVRKLMAIFEKKTNYVIHYRNLQQAIKNGLIVEKVHRVIQFNQSAWLADYIKLNTEMRKKAGNDFERDFFKLMNNAVFGRSSVTYKLSRLNMSRWLTSGEGTMPPLKGFRNRGYNQLGSTSSLDTVSTDNSSTGVLRPSSRYNKELCEKLRAKDREDNWRKLEDMNRKLGTKSKEQEKGHKGLFSSFEKLRTSFRGSSKSDAIRDWEQRQENKRNEKGLFASMDAKGHGSTSGNFEGWGGSRTKEKVRTVYVPIRVNSTPTTASRPVSRASTELPPYKERFETPDQVTAEGRIDNKRTGIYQKCPSPDSDDEIERGKLRSWIEYNESLELSVDKPTYLQRSRSTTTCSSPALGTVFEGYDENDSFVESDEINLVLSCTEYDGDWDSADEQDDKDSDMGEAEEAMRLTRPYNLGVPSGRRCPKNRIYPIQDPGTTEGQYGVPESKAILRLKGGANSSTGDNADQMDTDSLPGTSKGRKRLTDMSGYTEVVTPPSKRNKDYTPSPETESGKTSSFQNRGRTVLRFFESFKTACKKKLSVTAQQELDR
ncbi:hypothetical protein AGLY_002217 [Aphis glycines]|uniref:DNA-directed DNA polymerase n=1 Tax=Aphis glycines TaxID=307491 RepID=A0A6G0U386_APHGL|nr:hypothetical protein AGLY_002217 [Aphis glycines]